MTGAIFKKAGVIGWPVEHSKSPLIHNEWLRRYGVKGSYGAIPVAPDDLGREIRRLAEIGFCGFNVTLPHKRAIMPLLDFVRAEAEKIGAVNTVVVTQDGRLEGRNTDAFGFIENLKAGAPGLDFKKAPAVVFGAGGAARAVVYALDREGVPEIRIVNRDMKKAQELTSLFRSARAYDWHAGADCLDGAGLAVNATSLGMAGMEDLDVDPARLPPGAVVNDIVYVPAQTQFLRRAAAAGYTTVPGLGMLLHQARPAFQAWFGVMPDVDDALKALVAG